MSFKGLIVILATGFLFQGCAIFEPDIAKQPSAKPPRMMYDLNDIHINGLVWDKPKAFGPVPAHLKAKGNLHCRSVGFRRAVGYHPKAQNLAGQTLLGGGFYCSGPR